MTERDAEGLSDELGRRFGASVDVDEVADGRFRFALVSPQFAGVSPLRRQDQIWAVIDSVLDRELTLDISLVLAYAPDEIEVTYQV
jgi:acid stress-induced BolA-like protein IbaG/YrbA